VSYVIAHNVGASFIGGTAMRMHLYMGWGLSAGDVGGMAALNAATFWLGLLVLLGVTLLAAPTSFASVLPAHLAIGRPLGALCLALGCGYLLATLFLRVGHLAAWRSGYRPSGSRWPDRAVVRRLAARAGCCTCCCRRTGRRPRLRRRVPGGTGRRGRKPRPGRTRGLRGVLLALPARRGGTSLLAACSPTGSSTTSSRC
jgi:hypothetical protein